MLPAMRNAEIADAFAELADRLAIIDPKPYRWMAYRNAAGTFRDLGDSVAVLSEEGRLGEVDGVGPAIEEKVRELLATGTFPALKRAREDVPDTLLALTRLPGVGPATAKKVFDATDGESFASLAERAAAGTLPVGGGVTKKVLDALVAASPRRAGHVEDRRATVGPVRMRVQHAADVGRRDQVRGDILRVELARKHAFAQLERHAHAARCRLRLARDPCRRPREAVLDQVDVLVVGDHQLDRDPGRAHELQWRCLVPRQAGEAFERRAVVGVLPGARREAVANLGRGS